MCWLRPLPLCGTWKTSSAVEGHMKWYLEEEKFQAIDVLQSWCNRYSLQNLCKSSTDPLSQRFPHGGTFSRAAEDHSPHCSFYPWNTRDLFDFGKYRLPDYS